ncbi:hypothetical protein GCM10025876_24690 [Demequina litorisediminis]|uniref:Transposase n=1 Tax=Demequina litorisediminis TaxID=1849022 RepID=A0ABQ6IEK0_9MICO|nr:hypothetical protein GCM10025876_24690 [Demequina litorisediminis]
MRVHRRADLFHARFHVGNELAQRTTVIGLREALALQQAAFGEHRVGVQEAVRGDEARREGSAATWPSPRRTRAVVDLPTATEPAMPITYGVRRADSPRKALVAE